MTEAHVSDELAFTALPLATQELCKRLYGGTPEEINGQLDQYEHELFVAKTMGLPPTIQLRRRQ